MRFILVLFALNANADIEYKVAHTEYTWWDKARFPVTLHTIGYIHNIGLYNLSIHYGNSDRAHNSIQSGYNVNSKIKHLFSFGSGLSYRIKDISFRAGINYNEYKESINGIDKPDTDFGYYLGLGYELTSDVLIKLNYDRYYDKMKPGKGEELTAATGISLVYR